MSNLIGKVCGVSIVVIFLSLFVWTCVSIINQKDYYYNLSPAEQRNFQICHGKIVQFCGDSSPYCVSNSRDIYSALDSAESRKQFLKNFNCEVE